MNEPAVATWEERAVIAMGELLEANDKADIEAENQALATMGELIREHQEAKQAPRDPAGVQARDPAGVPGAQPAQPAGNDEQLRDALDHIMRVARKGISPTRRLDWIALRAKYALEGKVWSRDVREEPRDSVAKMENDNAELRFYKKEARELLLECGRALYNSTGPDQSATYTKVTEFLHRMAPQKQGSTGG